MDTYGPLKIEPAVAVDHMEHARTSLIKAGLWMWQKEREKALIFLSFTATLSSGGGRPAQISLLEWPGTRYWVIIVSQSFTGQWIFKQFEESVFHNRKYFYVIWFLRQTHEPRLVFAFFPKHLPRPLSRHILRCPAFTFLKSRTRLSVSVEHCAKLNIFSLSVSLHSAFSQTPLGIFLQSPPVCVPLLCVWPLIAFPLLHKFHL